MNFSPLDFVLSGKEDTGKLCLNTRYLLQCAVYISTMHKEKQAEWKRGAEEQNAADNIPAWPYTTYHTAGSKRK